MITPQHIDEVDYVIVDVETTGLSPATGDRVCEIGAVKLRGGAVMKTLGTLINPKRPISAGAYAVNGISPQMVAGAPTFGEIAGQLRELTESSVIVAYNAPFDLSFLVNEYKLLGDTFTPWYVADALAIARQVLPGLGKYSQENVARLLGIPFPVKHRALEDAMVTAQLFTMFTSILKAYDCHLTTDLVRHDLKSVMTAKRMAIVQNALSSRNNLWIKYMSPTNAEITERIISPKECIDVAQDRGTASYVIGYCHSAKGERNFRIDRILDVRILKTTT